MNPDNLKPGTVYPMKDGEAKYLTKWTSESGGVRYSFLVHNNIVYRDMRWVKDNLTELKSEDNVNYPFPKASHEQVKIGWKYDYNFLQKITCTISEHELQMEEVQSVLEWLDDNINFTSGKAQLEAFADELEESLVGRKEATINDHKYTYLDGFHEHFRELKAKHLKKAGE